MNQEDLQKRNIHFGRATVVAVEEEVVNNGRAGLAVGWALPGGEFTQSREHATKVAVLIDKAIWRGLARFRVRGDDFARMAA